jgi:hypothetical protein
MKPQVWTRSHESRRSFIGGLGSDEAALVRLCREKRGEADPERLSRKLIAHLLGAATDELPHGRCERKTGRHVRDVQRRVKHSTISWKAPTLDRHWGWHRGRVRGQFPWIQDGTALAAACHQLQAAGTS